jgi:2-polyprenyl-6-methoxyphenol hydroxylase-like FAD-dependent oxidoreductase
MDADVLIVGAGPTGLMLANQLGRRGVRVMVIDRHSGPAQQSRALGVQARTLEIYAQLGIAEKALELGKVGNGANLWARGKKLGQVPLGDAGKFVTPYPYILILGQDDNELIMGERLGAWNVQVQWNTELVALDQQAGQVTATLKQPNGSIRQVDAAWVAGCDGARSAVRELNGIEFAGAAYEHVFFVADTETTGNMVPDEVNVYLLKKGFHLFFPMRGKDHWRIVGILPPELRNAPDLKFEQVIPVLRAQADSDLSIRKCTWFSTYRIHHRAAVRFRERRCFVLGDAAHVHSPVGAQGMNTGLQDAYNLGWKLALVVKGQADAALLDSYEEERIPIARRLLGTTDRGFMLIVSDSWFVGLLRTQILARIAAVVMKFKAAQRIAFRTVSQTGIHYRWGRLSRSAQAFTGAAPRAGDRFPWLHLKFSVDGPVEDSFRKLEDTKFNLIAFGQPAPDIGRIWLGDMITVHTIPAGPENDREFARVGIPLPSYYLVRPDGYVGLCGGRFDVNALARYIADNLMVKKATAIT